MTTNEIRNWLGIYFLFTTVLLGAYILIFGETQLLPISKKDSVAAFQIVIPVLLSQLTTAFTWFANATPRALDNNTSNIPVWVVKAPPILVVLVIVLCIVSMRLSVSNATDQVWIDASTFKAVVTFCVSVLNVTSVLIVMRVFKR